MSRTSEDVFDRRRLDTLRQKYNLDRHNPCLSDEEYQRLKPHAHRALLQTAQIVERLIQGQDENAIIKALGCDGLSIDRARQDWNRARRLERALQASGLSVLSVPAEPSVYRPVPAKS